MKVTYLGHSGFMVRTEEMCLIFDYYRGDIPDPEGKKTLVFASHAHYDHFNKRIFELRKQTEDIRFILSSDIRKEDEEYEEDVLFMAPGEELAVFDCRIRTLRSNDQGVAYVVRHRDRTIYHAGDLNWWHWAEESDVFNKMIRRTYQYEINKLQAETIDAAFVPVDPRLGEHYCLGLDCFMKRVGAGYVFPMHFWDNYEIFDRLMLEKCTESYKDRIVKIEREGQEFLLEE